MTEKLYDCFLSMTLPIYWGCPNVDEYYPHESFNYIDINDIGKSIKMVKEIIQKPITTSNIKALHAAKNLTLDKYGIWPTVCDIINNKI